MSAFPFPFAIMVSDGHTMRTIHPPALGEHRAAIEAALCPLVMPGLVAVPAPPAAAPTTAAPDANTDTLTQREIAQAKGFSGNICTGCGGFNLKQSGHCEVCDDCGTTTGCS